MVRRGLGRRAVTAAVAHPVVHQVAHLVQTLLSLTLMTTTSKGTTNLAVRALKGEATGRRVAAGTGISERKDTAD